MAHSPNADDEKQSEAYRILERDAAGARAAEPVTYEGHPNVLLGPVPTAAHFQPHGTPEMEGRRPATAVDRWVLSAVARRGGGVMWWDFNLGLAILATLFAVAVFLVLWRERYPDWRIVPAAMLLIGGWVCVFLTYPGME